MLIEVNPYAPETQKIRSIAKDIQKGAIAIIPTDSVYAFCCDIRNKNGIEALAKLKGVKVKQANFSIICADLSNLSDYTRQIGKTVFKALKKGLPGPYTFILPANAQVGKIFDSNRKTIGLRIPDNAITKAIVAELGAPLVCTSVLDEDEIIEYPSDPQDIFIQYQQEVDLIIDGGYGNNQGSTILDATGDEILVIREGLGPLNILS